MVKAKKTAECHNKIHMHQHIICMVWTTACWKTKVINHDKSNCFTVLHNPHGIGNHQKNAKDQDLNKL